MGSSVTSYVDTRGSSIKAFVTLNGSKEGEDGGGRLQQRQLFNSLRKGRSGEISGQRVNEGVKEGGKQVHMINKVQRMARTRPHLSSETVYSARSEMATRGEVRRRRKSVNN